MKKSLKFIYQTGHGKELAKAEIESLSGRNSIVDEVDDGFVVEENLENPNERLNRMGGIVRIMEVVQSGPAHMPLNFEEWVSKAIKDEFKGYKGKMRYGLSMHPKSEKTLKKILISSKKNLKELGNLRFVNKDFENLSSVQAWHEHLLKPGAVELHLFKSASQWYLGKTVVIQDFEWYSKRDYGRPARSAKNGMFPPKLAQILINLAQPTPETTIFDPFCGSGTVLQEAFLMDLPSWGSDIDQQLISDCKANFDWLLYSDEFYEHLNQSPKAMAYVLLTQDATKLKEGESLPKSPFVIVSETYLGPPLNQPPDSKKLKTIQNEVEDLYKAFFKNLRVQITEPVLMIFTAPYHRIGEDRVFLPHLPAILDEYTQIIPLSRNDRPSLSFERKDQLVSREIWKVQIHPMA